MNLTCKNCKHHFEGNYCPNCGQTAHTHEINGHYLAHEMQHSIFHVDKGILYTTKELFTRPGHSIRGFMEGRRVRHFKPLAYLLILSTLYALLSKVLNVSTFLDEFQSGFSEAEKGKAAKSTHLISRVFTWLQQHYAYATVLLVPFASLASKLIFRKRGDNYVQHLVLNAYMGGQRTVMTLLFLPFYLITFLPKEILDNIQLVAGLILTWWTFHQYFQIKNAGRSFLLTVLFFAVMLLLLITCLIVVAIFTGIASGWQK